MVGKKFAALVLILGIFLGYQISNIYVNEHFEQKGFYRVIHCMVGVTVSIVNFLYIIYMILLTFLMVCHLSLEYLNTLDMEKSHRILDMLGNFINMQKTNSLK